MENIWPALTLVACLGLAALHLLWRRRFNKASQQLREQTEQNSRAREHQHAALAQAEAQQQAIFNSMVEGVLLLDADERVRLVNQALERSEERRVGKECRSRWSPEHEKKQKREEDKMDEKDMQETNKV